MNPNNTVTIAAGITSTGGAPPVNTRALMQRNIPGDRCPRCGAAEVESNDPRTRYACGASMIDGRPGTLTVGENCTDAPIRCQLPPTGWFCTREPGHEGPCAAVPIPFHESTLPAPMTIAGTTVGVISDTGSGIVIVGPTGEGVRGIVEPGTPHARKFGAREVAGFLRTWNAGVNVPDFMRSVRPAVMRALAEWIEEQVAAGPEAPGVDDAQTETNARNAE